MKTYETIRSYCKQMAEELEICCSKKHYLCPICGDIIEWIDANFYPEDDLYLCEHCHINVDLESLEALNIEDFFYKNNCMHTLYRFDCDGNFISVKTEVKLPGADEPLLVIDTEKQAVYALRFLTDVEWGLSLEAIAAINNFFENTMKFTLVERRWNA